MSPPIRHASHGVALWRGLQAGDIQTVATDHCAFTYGEQPHGLRHSKRLGLAAFNRIPNGAPGLETRLELMHDAAVLQHGLSLHRLVDLLATAPARLFGLFPRKGTVAVGSDADLVLFDPHERWTVRAAAPQLERLLAVRRPPGHRSGEEGLPAWAVHRRWAAVAGPRRHGTVSFARRLWLSGGSASRPR
ncbi:MAG: amidohydrolase family protein [Ideonella sp.]|nr:amidohydrolase family protein [Ideonella sp.]